MGDCSIEHVGQVSVMYDYNKYTMTLRPKDASHHWYDTSYSLISLISIIGVGKITRRNMQKLNKSRHSITTQQWYTRMKLKKQPWHQSASKHHGMLEQLKLDIGRDLFLDPAFGSCLYPFTDHLWFWFML